MPQLTRGVVGVHVDGQVGEALPQRAHLGRAREREGVRRGFREQR